MNNYLFFEIEKIPESKTAVVYLNRPEKLNAMNWPFWRDLPHVVEDLENDEEVDVVIFAGRGKAFSVGIDVFDTFSNSSDEKNRSTPELRNKMYHRILEMQEGFRRMMNGDNIYIGAAHRYCIGAGLDLMSACDLRLASRETIFSLRETRIAIVADMGSLNNLPRIIGHGNTRMMAFTGRDFLSEEVFRMGLLNEIYETPEDLFKGALTLAAEISGNACAVTKGVKNILNYMETHSAEDGLTYVATWNAAFLSREAIKDAVMKSMMKK